MIGLFLTNNKAIFLDVKAVPSASMDADYQLNNPEQVERLKGAIEEKLLDDGREENVGAMWREFKEEITEAADEILGEKKAYQGRKKMTPWWSEEVSEIVQLNMIKFRRWMKTRTAEGRQQYKNVRNETEKVKRRAKETCWRRIGADLENDLNGTKNLLYSLAKNDRGKSSEGTYALKDRVITHSNSVKMLVTDGESILMSFWMLAMGWKGLMNMYY